MDSTVPIKNEVLLLARENVKNSVNVYPIDTKISTNIKF